MYKLCEYTGIEKAPLSDQSLKRLLYNENPKGLTSIMSLTEVKENAIAQSGRISDSDEIPVIECEPITCATCPHFESYNDRGRGICKLFDRVERGNHTITQDCKNKIKTEAQAETKPVVKKPKTKVFPWVSMLSVVASSAIASTSIQAEAIASPEQYTPPTQKDQSPHRGSGRRELSTTPPTPLLPPHSDIDAEVEYVMAMEAKHQAEFNTQHNTVIEVETTLRNSNTVYGIWAGTKMIGTFYRAIDGRWIADSAYGKIRDRFTTSEQAKNEIVKAWRMERG